MSTFNLFASDHWKRVWVVKWTDTSHGYHFPCERRFPTRREAREMLAEFKERRRRYYTVDMEPFCPFRHVRMERER